MIACSVLKYKNHPLTYYKTNYGALFLARSLLALRKGITYCTSPLQNYVNFDLTVKIPSGGIHAPICVGLEGFKQIFKKKMDHELENLLISTGIISGKLPNSKDIKLLEDNGRNNSSVSKITDELLMKQLEETNRDLLVKNRRLQQQVDALQKQLSRYQRMYKDF